MDQPRALRFDGKSFRTWRIVRPTAGLLIAVSAGLMVAAPATAQLTQVYTFEAGIEGFGPNGGGVTVIDVQANATEGQWSLEVDIVQGATFVGALTTFLPPEIGDPPGVDVVVFDLTLTEAWAGPGYVDLGITVFGASQSSYPGGPLFGLQAQFLGNQFSVGALPPGAYEVRMELSRATHPLTFALNQSFNDIFGVEGSGPDDVIPTGFQIYVNKSDTAPWKGYIDNIRVGAYDADFNNDGFVNGDDLQIWEASFVAPNANADADLDGDSDGNDFLIWQRQVTPPAAAVGVPEPGSFFAAAVALLGARPLRKAARRRPG